MPILYIITGPAGVGKSTISKELAMSSNKSVLIEGDDIYHQVVGGYVPTWKERCITLLNSFKSRNYNAQNILDTTNLSISHTLEIIKNDNRFILL